MGNGCVLISAALQREREGGGGGGGEGGVERDNIPFLSILVSQMSQKYLK